MHVDVLSHSAVCVCNVVFELPPAGCGLKTDVGSSSAGEYEFSIGGPRVKRIGAATVGETQDIGA